MQHQPTFPFNYRKLRRLAWRRTRGFTLIEMMVVVIIITLLATIAVPGAAKRMKIYHSKQIAEEVAAVYRGARLRAMGRGSAVMVRFTDPGNFEVREAILGTSVNAGSAGDGCQTLPDSSCLVPANRWDSDDRSQRVDLKTFGSGDYDVVLNYIKADGTENTGTAIDICFSPLGRGYANMETSTLLQAMTTAPQVELVRKDGVGIPRSVLINTLGPARVVSGP